MFIAKNNELIVLAKETREELEESLEFINYTSIEETDIEYQLHEGQYLTIEEQAQKEAERIAKLFLTGADVERGIYQAKGMDFDDILAFVMANPPQGLDVKALRIELKANHFYRGNPYVNAVGGLLGFTSEQLDKFFETNDYTVLLPVEEPKMEIIEEPVVDNSENLEEENPVITETEPNEV